MERWRWTQRATNKIYAKVAAILTHLQIIEGELKSIREQTVDSPDHHGSNQHTRDSSKKQDEGVVGRSHMANAEYAKNKNYEGESKIGHCKRKLKKNLWKDVQKPKTYLEFFALMFLILYTWETHRTNNLTHTAMRVDPRAWVGISTKEPAAANLTNDNLDFTIAFEHAGKSPAINMVPCIQGSIIPMESRQQVYDASMRHVDIGSCEPMAGPAPLMPSQVGVVRQIIPFSSGEQSRAVAENRALIYVHGWFKYDDIFGDPHQTTYCTIVGPCSSDPNKPKIHGHCANGNDIPY
jgi:hypothetical protein